MTILVGLTALAGCGAATTPGYVERYPAALAAVEHDDGGGPVPEGAADRFRAFFEALPEPDVAARVAALYAPDAYFSDTLFLAEDRAALAAHFERLQRNDVRIAVELDDAVVDGDELYLRWRMHTDFAVGGARKSSATIGMTLLRFDRTGRIRFHQDFWDSTQGFYAHLPVVGAVIRSIGRRFADPEGSP
jgi:hypothetical protein